MKKKKNLYSKMIDLDVIIDMYDSTIKVNTKNKEKIEEFENYYSENMVIIKELLASKKYVPGKYNIFFIREPKLRIIMSQNVPDKIVNHLVAKYILIESFEDKLIEENCATRENKGTHYALRLFKKYLNEERIKYDKFYILKFDVNKYFYNIDHEIVKDMLRKRIKDKDALNIMEKIIDSTDNDYVNETIKKLKEENISKIIKQNLNNKEDKIKEINKIPLYKKGKGFPIGNMTSQIIATFYLNDLDHYIKEDLNIKYYIRYMDDGILIHHDKEYLKYALIKIEEYLKKYKLELNKKTKIYSSLEGIEFLGFRFYLKNKIILKVRNQTKNRFKRKMKKLCDSYENGLVNYNDVISVRNSYKGHLKHGSCKKLVELNVKKLDMIIEKQTGKKC